MGYWGTLKSAVLEWIKIKDDRVDKKWIGSFQFLSQFVEATAVSTYPDLTVQQELFLIFSL